MEVNPTVRVRFRYLDTLAQTVAVGRDPLSRALKEGVKALTSRRLRQRALRLTKRSVIYSDPAPPDEELMLELRRRFKPEIETLSEYLDRDLVGFWGYDAID